MEEPAERIGERMHRRARRVGEGLSRQHCTHQHFIARADIGRLVHRLHNIVS